MLGILSSAVIWGSAYFVIKDSVKDIQPIMLVAYRFILAAVIFAFIVIYRKEPLWRHWKLGLLLGFMVSFEYIPLTIGLQYTTASNSGFITGLFVIFTPFFEFIFFKRKPTVLHIIALVFALVGLWLITGGIRMINIGDILTVIAALAYGLEIVTVDKLVKNNISPFILNFQQFFFVGVISLCFVLLFHISFTFRHTSTFISICYLAFFCTVIAFGILYVAQKHIKPFIVALLLVMEPVFAAVFAWTLGHEKFIITHALGGVFILFAIIIAELPIKKLFNKNLRNLSMKLFIGN